MLWTRIGVSLFSAPHGAEKLHGLIEELDSRTSGKNFALFLIHVELVAHQAKRI
jgi:hypothetical protein